MTENAEQPEDVRSNELYAAAQVYNELGIPVVPFKITQKENGEYDKKNLTAWKEWMERLQTEQEFKALPWNDANAFAVILGTQAKNGCYLTVIDYDVKGEVSENAKAAGQKILKDFPVAQMHETVNKGRHLVYWSRNKTKTEGTFHDTAGLELLGEKKLCLMPPSIGYRCLNDNSPTEVENLEKTFYSILEKHGFKLDEEDAKRDIQDRHSFSITGIVDLTKLTKIGHDEYQGSHPVHGSTTGKNFHVNVKTNTWYCFRHSSGGGALQFLAVKEGLIRCEQAKKGALRGKKFKQAWQLAVTGGLVDKEQDEKRVESQADRLVKLCLGQEAELFTDQYGTPFIRYVEEVSLRYDDIDDIDGTFESFSAKNKKRENEQLPDKVSEIPSTSSYRHIQRYVNCPIHSKHFKTWLAYLFWESEGKAPGSEGVTSAMNVLMGKAAAEGRKYNLYNRVAPAEDGVWLDMCDEAWRAIKVTAEGWGIVDNPPIIFRRFNHQKSLVIPEKCSLTEARENIGKIFRYLNLKKDDKKSKLMFLCNVISYLIPTIPHPLLVVYGPQGSAKTWLCNIVRRLIDPSSIEVLTLPRDERELAQQLNHHWLVFYDNLSYLPQWASDMFCRAVTGAGISKRELYTDDDDIIYSIKRCLALNGINIAARKGDLLERSTLLPVERIPEENRKTEAEINEAFNKDKASILGAMLTILSETLRLYPSIKLKVLERMADFNKYGCAIAQALGKTAEDFLSIFKEKVTQQNEEAINADPVAVALLDFLQIHFRKTTEEKLLRENWKGTPTLLLQAVRNHAETMGIRVDPKHFPRTPNAFMRRINGHTASFMKLGFEILTKPGITREVIISPNVQASLLLPEFSNTPEENEPVFNECCICSKPIFSGEEVVTNYFTDHQPAHQSCYVKLPKCWNTCLNFQNQGAYGCTHPNPASLTEDSVRPLRCHGFRPINQEVS